MLRIVFDSPSPDANQQPSTKMKNTLGVSLLCAFHNLIAQAIPLGTSAPLIIKSPDIWANPAAIGAGAAGNGQVVFKSVDGLPLNTPFTWITSPVVTTTKTVTSIVTHTVPWSPPPTPGSQTPTTAGVTATPDTRLSPKNSSCLPWNLGEQPPAAATKISILWVICSIMCISLAYVFIHMIFILSRHRIIRRYCCFWTGSPTTDNALQGVELEESAGVSWTEGSNLTTPHPETRAPQEWPGSWADIVAVGQAGGSFGSTGRSGVWPRGGTVKRSTNIMK